MLTKSVMKLGARLKTEFNMEPAPDTNLMIQLRLVDMRR